MPGRAVPLQHRQRFHRRRRPGSNSGRTPASCQLDAHCCGSGQGLFAVPFFTAALRRVRPHETGSAAGLLNAAQQLGDTLGIALLGTIFLRTAADGPSEPARAVLNGARHAFWVAVALIAATGVAAAFLHAASRTDRGRLAEEGDWPRRATGRGGRLTAPAAVGAAGRLPVN
ncbi:hypothetical protein ACFTZK_04455 [Streptomyces decoyicus]|uniref:hypothetical protein n=1 Tax=Streptomyces decoyicus TaxID=249567 RepID=UPI0036419A43